MWACECVYECGLGELEVKKQQGWLYEVDIIISPGKHMERQTQKR